MGKAVADESVFTGATYRELEAEASNLRHVIGCLLTKMGDKVAITKEDVDRSAGERWYVELPKSDFTTTVFRTYK